MKRDTMELSVWGGDWGIASVDPACLSMMAYVKFSGAPITVKATNNPYWTPTGTLPVYYSTMSKPSGAPADEYTDYYKVVQVLRDHSFSADYNLSSRQKSEVLAFSRLIEDRLKPALLQLFWLDAKNQLELTRPWYASKMGLPLSLYYPNKMVSSARDAVASYVDVSCGEGEDAVTVGMVEAAVYKRAEECLSVLARRLGDEPYFFGKSPSSLDALMYGYLAPLLKAPLPNPALQNHLKASVNLVSFVVRITQNYFSETALAYEKKMSDKQAEEAAKVSKEGVVVKNGIGDWLRPLAAGVVSCSAMLGYAYFSGLVDLVRTAEARNSYSDDDD